jgi:hypothetical protein
MLWVGSVSTVHCCFIYSLDHTRRHAAGELRCCWNAGLKHAGVVGKKTLCTAEYCPLDHTRRHAAGEAQLYVLQFAVCNATGSTAAL